MKAFEARDPARTGIYSFEVDRRQFDPAQAAAFKRSAAGWKWFRAQAESYQRVATHWVVSAKQEGTRARRLTQLIEHSSAREKLRQFTPTRERTK
jgi:hypothetical protein